MKCQYCSFSQTHKQTRYSVLMQNASKSLLPIKRIVTIDKPRTTETSFGILLCTTLWVADSSLTEIYDNRKKFTLVISLAFHADLEETIGEPRANSTWCHKRYIARRPDGFRVFMHIRYCSSTLPALNTSILIITWIPLPVAFQMD